MNPETVCFGTPRPMLQISGGACIQNNLQKEITITIQTTTIMSTPQTVVKVQNAGWSRDLMFFIFGIGAMGISIFLLWCWRRFGSSIPFPAMHFLTTVFFCLYDFLKIIQFLSKNQNS
jgi:hypothetical protein